MVAMATQADQSLRQNGNAAPGKLSAAATYLQSSIFSETLRKGTCFCFISVNLFHELHLLVVVSAGAGDTHAPKCAGMQHCCIRTQSCCFQAEHHICESQSATFCGSTASVGANLG